MYELRISKRAEKFLMKQSQKTKTFVAKKLIELRKSPYQNSLDIQKLSGVKNAYRLRIWKIRILYRIYEREILIFVFDMGYRGDVYK